MTPIHLGQQVLIPITLAAIAVLSLAAYLNRRRLAGWTYSVSEFFSPESTAGTKVNWPLFWVSFTALFVEIMMIRWIGTEIRVFAYFQNLALIACFLGFGLGCYWSARHKSLIFSLFAIAGLTFLAEIPSVSWQSFLTALSNRLSLSPDAAMWGYVYESGGRPPSWFLLFAAALVAVAVFLLLLVIVMIPLGQWVGAYLDNAPNPIQAYSANLLGSVAGIWVFAGLAFLHARPTYWFLLAIGLLVVMPPFSRRLALGGVMVAAVIVVLFHYSGIPRARAYWSPYQKLEVLSNGDSQYSILVNNTGYMNIANMTPEFLVRNPGVAGRYKDESSYDAPFRFAPSVDRVLIVGAGAGNDAAAALRNQAKQVDAVEIDPVILALGKQLHPEGPYRNPAVHQILNDARAFLRQSKEKYDVIVFGLLDSHTQFSDYSNMRVDNYVYTEEAFRRARSLLKPNGILVVKFEVRAPWTWMGERFNAMLGQIFARPPIVFYAPLLSGLPSATVFIESDDPGLWQRSTQPELAAIVNRHPVAFSLDAPNPPPPATDDWPYVYHRYHSIPHTYLTISLILLVMVVLLVRGSLEPARASTWQFFFLGAGFLLLETQMVSRLALYFGTTWLVNCVALTAILLVLVGANVYVSRRPVGRLEPYYALLVVFLLLNYFFPWQALPYAARTVGVFLSMAYAIPVFFAGVIFTEAFRRYPQKSAAFGANIVGAVAGGLAQNISFIFGMKMLLICAACFYISAALCGMLMAAQPARSAQAKPLPI